MKKALILLLMISFLQSCGTGSQSEHTELSGIELQWEFIGNNSSDGYYESIFTLVNKGSSTLGEEGWAIFFNQMGSSEAHEIISGKATVIHIKGDLFRLTPEKGFILEPDESVEIILRKGGWLIKEVEAPLGPYIVYEGKNNEDFTSIAVDNYVIKEFPELEKIFPAETNLPIPGSAWIYELNKEMQVLPVEDVQAVLPSPRMATYSDTPVRLGRDLKITYQEGLDSEARFLKEMLQNIVDFIPEISEGLETGSNIIQLGFNTNSNPKQKESYELTSSAENGIIILGGGPAGVFYGIQSLLALAPVSAWDKPEGTLNIKSVSINDRPDFEYRGMMLDLSRNFNKISNIKKLIQALSFYKFNKLHLHLTDDEGWRIEIKSLPELTKLGGFRGHTETKLDHLAPAYGSGPVPDTGKGFGSGFLTQEDFIGILKFASRHHIEVIPEINFPGHSRAAIYAMEERYHRLMKEGREDEAMEYRLIDPENRSVYLSAQNYKDNVVSVCQESTFRFYETIVDELIDMYEKAGLRLNVLHVGGDEVPHGAWDDSPIAQEFLKAHPEIGGMENLQPYFEGRLFEILKKKNLIMGGWEEIAMKKDENGRWNPNPEFAGQGMLPFVWNSRGDYLDLGNRMANANYPVILCNVSNFYFDLGYNHHPSEPGHYWGGFTNTRTAFEFAPYNVFASTITDQYKIPYDPEKVFAGKEKLKTEAFKNIKGIQGTLWSETIKGGEMLEYYYLPKIIGLAERAWSGQDAWADIGNLEERVEAIQLAWNDFANAIGQRELPRLDYLYGGYNYRLPPPGGKILDGILYANVDFPGLTIRYTTDGSDPDRNSPLFTEPVEVKGNVKLRSFDTRERGSRIYAVDQ